LIQVRDRGFSVISRHSNNSCFFSTTPDTENTEDLGFSIL